MATFASSSVAAAQPYYRGSLSRSSTASTDDMSRLSEDNRELPADSLPHADSDATRNRKKSIQDKYHPVDAFGKPLHAKIVNATTANPHHTHLDLHHPSPVRTPSPSRVITNSKYIASKLGKTEKMKIDKYEDGKKHILVGATGSVASVKIPLIVKSLLAHEEVEVQVIVTKTAKHFFDVDKLKTELGVKVWEDEDDWKVFSHYETMLM
jgi:Flavoprotein